MRVFVYSSLNVKEIKHTLLKNGFVVSRYKPDVIITYGGDGTTLSAEREYPGIPKLIVKTSKITHPYEIEKKDLEIALKKIKKSEYKIVEESKLIGTFKNKTLIGLNEIQVHTEKPIAAIRFSVYANNRSYEDLIGDGVLVATPFGSSGYYKSLGGRIFKKGLGLGFNNIHNKRLACIHLPSLAVVKIKIKKGEGLLTADNNPRMYSLEAGDEIEIRKHKEQARFIQVL